MTPIYCVTPIYDDRVRPLPEIMPGAVRSGVAYRSGRDRWYLTAEGRQHAAPFKGGYGYLTPGSPPHSVNPKLPLSQDESWSTRGEGSTRCRCWAERSRCWTRSRTGHPACV
ncbi:hypothetical protein FRACA_680024 [Frankia canadensis]|uniref:Uncharacterized protein n=1 Tax=Frankia canadensis TaxID=1836972 RepID=A0A2I2L0B7_9ACTN|nr:hypothetical protein FRACA_680024 [Frankia canadensis]SOU58640.1 hypothetical protein FRACA_680024 [Frankia canadensis]